ncbi:MAG: hypothetical protein KFF49_12505 [Bacteroidales bacterium]|nr:hypothetical protein [Bacteroidales bacterium]
MKIPKIITVLVLACTALGPGVSAVGIFRYPPSGSVPACGGQSAQDNMKEQGAWLEMYFMAIKAEGKLQHYYVSSELEPVDPFQAYGRYGGHHLFDNDPATAWVEGVEGHGEGEYLIAGLGESIPDTISIHNGYQKSERLYKMNSRPHIIGLSLYAGIFLEGDHTEIASRYRVRKIAGAKTIELPDSMGKQSFDLSFPEDIEESKDSLLSLFISDFAGEIEERQKLCPTCDLTPQLEFFIKLEIINVYKGDKWDDTCISGIRFEYPVKNKELIREDEIIIKVYEDDEPDTRIVYVDTDKKKNIVLVDRDHLTEYLNLEDDEQLSITLMDVSPDKEWAQLDLMFFREGAPRVEEYSVLYNIRMLRRVDDNILGIKYGIFGFIDDNGKIWLDTIDGYIDLDRVRERMRSSAAYRE